jgi:hypothetical protein
VGLPLLFHFALKNPFSPFSYRPHVYAHLGGALADSSGRHTEKPKEKGGLLCLVETPAPLATFPAQVSSQCSPPSETVGSVYWF